MNIHSSMTPPTSNPTATGAKREAILDAALELFVERGFHGTAVPAVADRAGVGAGTIYRYFASKEALVNALYQQAKGAISEHVLDDFPTDAAPRELLNVMWTRMAQWVIANPRAFAFLELHHHASYLDEDSRAIEDRLFGFARMFVVQAQGARILKSGQPEVLIAIVFGAFVGLMRASWEGRVELTPETLRDGEQCCWEAIRA